MSEPVPDHYSVSYLLIKFFLLKISLCNLTLCPLCAARTRFQLLARTSMSGYEASYWS